MKKCTCHDLALHMHLLAEIGTHMCSAVAVASLLAVIEWGYALAGSAQLAHLLGILAGNGQVVVCPQVSAGCTFALVPTQAAGPVICKQSHLVGLSS